MPRDFAERSQEVKDFQASEHDRTSVEGPVQAGEAFAVAVEV
jgi:hypothetical protein